MKCFFSILILASLFLACSKKNEGTAAPVDNEKLDASSQVYCSANQKFQVFTGDLRLYRDGLPNPVLFSIQKGPYSCASLHDIDHGGASSWLNVTFSTECVLNGSLWLLDSLSNQDGDKVYLNLRSLDPAQNNWIHVFTSYGYSTRSLSSEMGLVIYNCAQ